MAFASLTIDLNARLANIEKDLGRVAHEAEKRAQAIQKSFGALGGVLASALSVGGFAAFVKSAIDAADNLNDLAKKTGVAVSTLAGLDLAAKSTGTNLEDVGTAVGRLNKYMGEAAAGSREQADMLKALGVTAKTPEEALYQLADAFNRMGSEGDKARAFSDVLGKSWQNLAPLLSEGGAGLRALVEEGQRLNPVTKEMAEQADKFNDALARFKVQASGAGTALANALLPAMNDVLSRWNDAIRLSQLHGGFVSLILGGVNPTGKNETNLKAVRDEITAIHLQLKDAGSVQGDIAGIDEKRLRARLAELEAIKKSLLEIQGAQALALNDKYGTGDYKVAKTPGGDGKIKLPPEGGGKSKAKSSRVSDAEWAMEESAHLARTYHQIAQTMDEARLAAFERADEAANEWQAGLDAANAKLREAAERYIDLIDPVEKYRRQLQEVRDLVDQGLLTPAQATEAEFAIQQQIDSVAGLGEEIKQTKSIAEELGLTFSSAFEDAVVGGKGLRDILDGIYKDILRITVRKTVTEPLSAGFSDLLKGVNWAGILPSFAVGTDYVPRDMLAVIHKGERITPAAENRAGGGGVTVHMTVVTQDAGSFRRSMGQVQSDLAAALQGARRFA